MPSMVFNLPDLGEGLPDAEIVEWHVKAGDRIRKDQVMVSVETAKAVVEVPSPFEGKLLKAYGDTGDIIDVGQPLAEFEVDQLSTEKTEDAGTVVGKMDKRSTVVKETIGTIGKDVAEVRAAPAVRALAKRLNVDLSVVKPSGPEGVITADDVKRVANVLAELGPIEPLRGVRRAMARSMSMAHEQVVPVTLHDDADIDHWSPEDDISSRLVMATVAACEVKNNSSV